MLTRPLPATASLLTRPDASSSTMDVRSSHLARALALEAAAYRLGVRSGGDDEGEPRRWLERLGAGSAMGRAVGAYEWDRTLLRDSESWPVELRALVQLCLTTRFPILVTWGPELLMIYNDGYRDMIGGKHPAALGAPLAEVWAEIWDVIGPMVHRVMATGEPTWSELERLLIDRHGFVEETFFTFSYSPAFDGDGRAQSLVDVATEMTAQVVAQRRTVALAGLGEAVFSASQVTGVCLAAAAQLAMLRNDIIHADVFLAVSDEPVLIASTRQGRAGAGRIGSAAHRPRGTDHRARATRRPGRAVSAGRGRRAPQRKRWTERGALRRAGSHGRLHG